MNISPNYLQLGVAGIICVLLTIAVVVLWRKLEAKERQAREDQERVLPALTQATLAMQEFARVAAVLIDRDRG